MDMDWDERVTMGRASKTVTRRDRPVSRTKLPRVAERLRLRREARRLRARTLAKFPKVEEDPATHLLAPPIPSAIPADSPRKPRSVWTWLKERFGWM